MPGACADLCGNLEGGHATLKLQRRAQRFIHAKWIFEKTIDRQSSGCEFLSHLGLHLDTTLTNLQVQDQNDGGQLLIRKKGIGPFKEKDTKMLPAIPE